jgi:hypothetical protein
MRKNFYLTFGQKSPAKNGWVRVEAPNVEKAREMVFNMCDDKWAFLYTEDEFEKEHFPAGELGVLK